MRDLRQPRHNIKEWSHVSRLFLHPNDFPGVWMSVNRRTDFRLRHWIKLVEEKDRGTCVLAAAPFGAEFMTDFAACDQYALGVCDFSVLHNLLKVRLRELVNRRTGVRVTQHAPGCEHHQRLAPRPPRLPPQYVKVLRRRGGLAHLHVFFRRELQVALEPSAGMFRPLPLIAVRKQQYNSRRQIPFVLARADKLIDDHLRAVRKIAELRLPQN